MARPLRICRENDIDISVVSASSAVSSTPASNVKTADIRHLWRATTNTAWLLADYGQSLTLGVTLLVNTNLTQSETIRVRFSTTDSTGAAGDAYDSGPIASNVDPRYSMFVHFIEPGVLGRYLRIDFTQAAAPEVGRWMAGEAWEPAHHFAPGFEQLRSDYSRRAVSLGQNIFIDRQPRQRVWRFTLRGLSDTDANVQLEAINRANGSSVDLLVCRDRNSTNYGRDSIWGLLDEPVTYAQMDVGGNAPAYEATMTIRERV